MAHLSETVIDGASAMREGVHSMFTKGADLATSLGDTLGDTSTELVGLVRRQIKRNPMAAIGIAFAGGLLLGAAGLLLTRRRRGH
jgi:LPXTG-motif cell wall-anchored protein